MLTTIGMLHHQKKPEKLRKAYACAAVAKMEQFSFFYFTFEDVNMKEELIQGKVYEDGEWKGILTSYPDVIYNAGSPRSKRERKINNHLKEFIPYTSYSIGNKYAVYQRMEASGEFDEILIPSHEINNAQEVFRYMEQYKKVVLKPKKGSKGKEIIFMDSLKDDVLNWTEHQGKEEVEVKDATFRINQKIQSKAFLLQPYLQCLTKNGNPFDFRIHVQKNGEGLWVINHIYPRVGQLNGIVSNIHSGGYRADLEAFLRNEFPKSAHTIQNSLETFADWFPAAFEQLYDCSFDELGIDVGLDHQMSLKIFEVNWRPGSKYRELEAARNLVLYANYLAEKGMGIH
ncbi:YheC/YheD family protein [Bacillus sp. AK128]